MNQTETFLKLVFPWDTAHENLFKCVTWTWGVDPKDGRPMFANHAAKTWDELTRLIHRRSQRPGANVYVALGTQHVAKGESTKDGFLKAIRKANNIATFNSIFLDIDVKENAYATTEEAFEALDDLITKTGLPPATMEVLSGSGGVHVYWCTKEPMPLNQWTPLAKALRDAAVTHGLKFDTQCTIDSARILRVPGTLNYKTVPPKPVTLLDDCSFQVYDYQDLVNALQPYIGMTMAAAVPGQVQAQAVPGRRSGIAQNFTAGIDNGPPIPIDNVALVCDAVKDVLGRAGAGDSEPLWNQMLYLAAFTADPKDAAHRLSSGYKGYTVDETDKKLNEKLTARANNNSGWPQCATISGYHKACATCPLLAAGKSPLHHAPRPTPQAPQFTVVQNNDPFIPNGYRRDANNHIWGTVTDGEGASHNVDVLGYPVLDAGIDEEDFGRIVFKTVISGVERWSDVDVSKCVATAGSAGKTVGEATKIHVPVSHHKLVRDFVVAWVNKLQQERRFVRAATLGWSQDGKGFSFNGMTYSAAGDTTSFHRGSMDNRYGAIGDLKPWQDAMRLVYGSSALETLVACSFASPLVELTATASLIVSAYSKESGAGKSTAFQLGQSVWGDPRSGMSGLEDTVNSVMKKAQDLKNLPIYYDELRTKDQMERAINIVFQMTQGKAKAKLNRDSSQMTAGAFTLLFCVASNYGIADIVWAGTENTEAGGLRVFEMRVPPMPRSSLSNHDSESLKRGLGSNYGRAGELYAAYLAHNRKAVEGFVANTAKQLNDEFKFEVKERFWSQTMSSILAAAVLANHIGLTSFNLPAIKAYLADTLATLRLDLAETYRHVAMSDPSDGRALLQEMMTDLRGKHMITTNVINYPGVGRQPKVDPIDMSIDQIGRMQNVWMQVGVNDGRIRAVRRQFDGWLREHHYNPRQIIDMLKRFYVVTPGRQTIGAGIPYLNAHALFGQLHVYDFTPLNAPGSSPDGQST